MSPEMQALYHHCVSTPRLAAMFREKATENAANMIAHLFTEGSDQAEQAEQIIKTLEGSAPRGKVLSEDLKSNIRGLVGQKFSYPSSCLSDEQIAQLAKPKSFSEIRETLQAIMRGGREATVAELSKLPVFGRIKKGVRREFIRQNFYKMERDGQAERIGTQGRSTIWRLS